MIMESHNSKSSLSEKREDSIEELKNKNAGKNVFETLLNIFLEEKESNRIKYEDLSNHIDKLKVYFDEKINVLKDNTHENLEELKYYLDQLNKNIKENAEKNSTYNDDFDTIRNEMLHLKKQKEDDINLMKSSIQAYSTKIKNVYCIFKNIVVLLEMISIMNKNIETIKEELTNSQENIKIESKKKYIEILELINNENDSINKKIKQPFDELNNDIKDIKEYIRGVKDSLENEIKDIKSAISTNKKSIDEKISPITINQKRLMNDFYPTEKS
ncbi:conserved Plasmodium protein, unknown function [Plasmodium vinckei vinckei]|uniref:Uncharacterized protein n=1 Tax=Plasmodium vinckei vinckei TaxID=54757 RepID=A0A449BXT1_PLAVN|nr:conserved Plasmodium protein, unknown function [Plasmodium vinckei vinckei]VEV58244.1 conserved Plasmodium protein, unknown function [Plasmodium vinckei vinckei]